MNKVSFYFDQQEVYAGTHRDNMRSLIAEIVALTGSDLRLSVRRAKLAGTKFFYEFGIDELGKVENLVGLLSEKRNIGFKIVGKVVVNNNAVKVFCGGCLK